jgi:hypothetical protein
MSKSHVSRINKALLVPSGSGSSKHLNNLLQVRDANLEIKS